MPTTWSGASDLAASWKRSLASRNKLPEHAARIGGVLALIDDLTAPSVAAECMAAGIALAEHYAAEALRLFSAKPENAELRLADRLRGWLFSWPEPVISLPDIYQRGLNAIPDAATARRLAAILEDHGWIIRLDEGAQVGDFVRREVWRIVREGAR